MPNIPMIFRKFLIFASGLFLLTLTQTQAQEKSPVRYGRITPADFSLPPGSYDTSAAAVVIADIGSSEFVGNSKGWFSLQFRHLKRIKILSKQGFEAATVNIPLYVSGSAVETVDGLKAVTYNLENGKVTETRLEDRSIFTDKVSKHLILKKFTFPALKEGSIIEFTYTQLSDFLTNLQPWEFQGPYPCLWSEYSVAIPNFFQYVTLAQGELPFSTKTTDSRNVSFRGSIPGGADADEHFSFEDNVVDRRWVMKDVPALKEEAYTTTVDNYIAKLEFQLSRYAFPNSMIKDKMGNWFSISKGLMKSEDFGADLTSSNGWMDEDLKNITRGVASDLEKAKKVYAWVRDNFTCTGYGGSIYLYNPLKTVFKNRNGTAAELNLLLTAMLKHLHIASDPVILSTRAHGFTHEMYPLLSRFNYVISRAIIDSSGYYLDASEAWLGFGRLPNRCYNGHARVITDEMALPVYMDADALQEKSTTVVFMSNEKKGFFSGEVQTVPGYIESSAIREKVHKKGETVLVKSLQSAYPGETTISNVRIDSLKIQDEPVGLTYDFAWKIDDNDALIYFNPMLGEGRKENPFRAAERKYPVEMSYAMDEIYTLNMEIPEGYEVDELPKSAKVLYNDDEGFFEYLMAADKSNIQFRSRIKLKKANFKQEDYASLRDFFAFIVKKQNEQVVFKKKK